MLALALAACSPSETELLQHAKSRLAQADAASPGASQPAGRRSAELELRNLLAKYPKSAEGRYLLGMELLRKADPASARVELDRARELKFDPDRVMPALARALIQSGNAARVIENYAELSLSQPAAQAALKTALAEAYWLANSKNLAQQAVADALAAHPQDEAARLLQVRMAWHGGQRAQAQTQLQTLLAQPGASGEAYTLQAELLAAEGRPLAEVSAALQTAAQRSPQLLAPRTRLMAIQLMDGQLEQAGQTLKALRQIAPNRIDTGYLEATLAARKGELTQARSIFQAILRSAPHHLQTLLGAAEVEYRLNSFAQAAALAGKAMSQAPQHAGARLLLARAQIKQNQGDAALSTLEPLLDGARAHPQAVALAAEADLAAGRVDAAQRRLDQLRALKPTDPRLRTLLAMAQLGRPDAQGANGSDGAAATAALHELQDIASHEDSTQADLMLVGTHVRERRWPQALAAIDQLQRKRPQDALPEQLRAVVQRQAGDLDAARRHYQQALAKDARYMPAVLGLTELDLQQGQLQPARSRLEALLKQQPKNQQALLALAEVQRRSHQPAQQVQATLERAVAADPDQIEPRLALIDYHTRIGNLPDALSQAQLGVAAHPHNLRLLLALARLQLVQGQHDAALDTAGRITAESPNSQAGHVVRAQAFLAAGKLADAERSADFVLQRAPLTLEAQAVKMRVHLARQQPEAALALALAVQKQRPQEAIGWLIESEIAAQQGRWAQAAGALQAVLQRAPSGAHAIRLHLALQKAGQTAQAEQLAERWQREHPQDADFLAHLGDLQDLQAHQPAAAEALYRRGLAANPQHLGILNNLAMLLARQKKPGGLALVDQALALSPRDPNLLDTRAQVLAAEGRYDEAVDAQQQALKLAPQADALRLALARLQLQAGQKREARDQLRRLLDADSRLSDAQRQQARQMLDDIRS